MAGFGTGVKKFMGWYDPEEDDPAFVDVVEDDYQETVEPMESAISPLRPAREPMRRSYAADHDASMSRIVTVHPESFSEAPVIGESFREGIPVIINLTELSDEESRRVIDFAAGLVFALRGNIERVTPRVFLVSPQAVEVKAEKGRSSSSSLFGQG